MEKKENFLVLLNYSIYLLVWICFIQKWVFKLIYIYIYIYIYISMCKYNTFYHIFVRNTYLFTYVINEEVPGANNGLFCPASMTSLWHVSKHDRRGSIQHTDTTEMKNINVKRKTESDIRIFKDWLSTLGELDR